MDQKCLVMNTTVNDEPYLYFPNKNYIIQSLSNIKVINLFIHSFIHYHSCLETPSTGRPSFTELCGNLQREW